MTGFWKTKIRLHPSEALRPTAFWRRPAPAPRLLRCGWFLLPAALCLVLVGCGGGEITPDRPLPPRAVRIDWLGHESFLFESSIGTKLITNPFESSATGIAYPKGLRPEIVLVSNERPEANNINAFDNFPAVFRGAVGVGSHTATGIHILGIPTDEKTKPGEATERNLVFVWQMDGIRFCFPGNLESVLPAPKVLQIGRVDVLFLPVGTPRGLSDAERRTLVHQLRPRVIIPMGRRGAISQWVTGIARLQQLPGPSVMLYPDRLPLDPMVLIFGPPKR